MIFSDAELNVLKDLQTQEESCVEKYAKYEQEAKDPVLKDLFHTLHEKELEHVKSIQDTISGKVPCVNCNDESGKNYCPKCTYGKDCNEESKKHDSFLATDAISGEKLISSEYNSDVFAFGQSEVRKLFADIQVEEQNHAEMLYKYKSVNGMTE
ncbi:MAG: ferritin-like domain-containing protein [Lachnospiraceae bacterium]